MPGKLTKPEEKDWKSAKSIVRKTKDKKEDKFKDIDWGLVQHIFKLKRKKHKKKKASVSVVVEPYEPLVNKAMDLIESKNPGYFNQAGVKKIQVESGDMGHLGKVESDKNDTIFVSVNKIKSILGAAGTDENEVIRQIALTLAHEAGHLKSKFQGGEGPAEAEESKMKGSIMPVSLWKTRSMLRKIAILNSLAAGPIVLDNIYKAGPEKLREMIETLQSQIDLIDGQIYDYTIKLNHLESAPEQLKADPQYNYSKKSELLQTTIRDHEERLQERNDLLEAAKDQFEAITGGESYKTLPSAPGPIKGPPEALVPKYLKEVEKKEEKEKKKEERALERSNKPPKAAPVKKEKPGKTAPDAIDFGFDVPSVADLKEDPNQLAETDQAVQQELQDISDDQAEIKKALQDDAGEGKHVVLKRMADEKIQAILNNIIDHIAMKIRSSSPTPKMGEIATNIIRYLTGNDEKGVAFLSGRESFHGDGGAVGDETIKRYLDSKKKVLEIYLKMLDDDMDAYISAPTGYGWKTRSKVKYDTNKIGKHLADAVNAILKDIQNRAFVPGLIKERRDVPRPGERGLSEQGIERKVLREMGREDERMGEKFQGEEFVPQYGGYGRLPERQHADMPARGEGILNPEEMLARERAGTGPMPKVRKEEPLQTGQRPETGGRTRRRIVPTIRKKQNFVPSGIPLTAAKYDPMKPPKKTNLVQEFQKSKQEAREAVPLSYRPEEERKLVSKKRPQFDTARLEKGMEERKQDMNAGALVPPSDNTRLERLYSLKDIYEGSLATIKSNGGSADQVHKAELALARINESIEFLEKNKEEKEYFEAQKVMRVPNPKTQMLRSQPRKAPISGKERSKDWAATRTYKELPEPQVPITHKTPAPVYLPPVKPKK